MIITVIAAIIKKDNKILIGRRAPYENAPGMWELPGGKLKNDESKKDCLKRELKEELGIDANIGDLYTNYVYEYPQTSYDLWFYNVYDYAGEFQYNAHDKLECITPEKYNDYNFLPGDIPLLDKLR